MNKLFGKSPSKIRFLEGSNFKDLTVTPLLQSHFYKIIFKRMLNLNGVSQIN